jgi:rhamnopyranosyl-N-acetylglucosaminyl-diphospho-decaprenol beta-1,3/1,4-galactofuranosyltransferase
MKRILVGVVTFNRCELLKRCINYINNQKKEFDELIVVDNGSTDDTINYLTNNDINHIRNPISGSAKGWFTIIEYAIKNEYDLVWLMDDDGYPEKNALLHLINNFDYKKDSCLSSIVVNENSHNDLVFPIPITDSDQKPIFQIINKKYSTVIECKKKSINSLITFVHLFNGALININKVKKIGNINLNLYHHGSEIDYYYRLSREGNMFTCCEALHYHPDINKRSINNLWIYYYLMNSLLVNKKYLNFYLLRNLKVIFATLIRIYQRNGLKYLFFNFFFNKNIFIFFKAIFKGIFNKI